MGVWGEIKKIMKLKNKIRTCLRSQLSMEPTVEQVNWCFWDFLKFKFKYGGSLETDYFGTQMYRKSDFVRKESFANQSRFEWRNKIQDPALRDVFDDKVWFYDKFKNHLNRKYMVVEQNTSREEFHNFIKCCNYEVIAKVPDSFGGKGVKVLYLRDPKEQERLYLWLIQSAPMVIEEKLIQCDDLKSFSTSSVNTLRVITIVDQFGKPHVARVMFRIGRGDSILDNFSSGGMGAHVDVDTGVIYTVAKDKLGKEYIYHPDTGKKIVGHLIDDWQGYKQFAITLASQFPTVRYVGWDIMKNSKGEFCVIEGNREAGFDVMEAGLLYGLKPQFDALLNGREL